MVLPLLTFRILLKTTSSSESVSIGDGDSVQKIQRITLSFPREKWILIFNLTSFQALFLLWPQLQSCSQTHGVYLCVGMVFSHVDICSGTQSCEPPNSSGCSGINPVPRAIPFWSFSLSTFVFESLHSQEWSFSSSESALSCLNSRQFQLAIPLVFMAPSVCSDSTAFLLRAHITLISQHIRSKIWWKAFLLLTAGYTLLEKPLKPMKSGLNSYSMIETEVPR